MNNRSLTERLWEVSLTELDKEATGDSAWTYIEELIKDNDQLKTELTRAEDENSTVEKECSQLKEILHFRNQLDEEMEEEEKESHEETPTLSDESAIATRLDHVTAENQELEEKLSRLEAERDRSEEQLNWFRRKTNELSGKLRASESLIDRLSEKVEEILRLQKENSNQKEKIARLASHRRKCLVENQELIFELERRNEEIAELSGKLHEMERWYEEYRSLLEDQKAANASLRHEQRPRVLRFINTPDSPYISQRSMSSEIEESIRSKQRQRHWSESELESSVRLRNIISLVQLTNGGGGGGEEEGGGQAEAAVNVRQRRRRVQSENSPSSVDDDDDRLDCCNAPQPELWFGSSMVEADDPEESSCQGHDDDVNHLESMATNISFLPLGCPGRPGSMDLEFALGLRLHLSPLQTGQLTELWNHEDGDSQSRRIDEEETYSTGCETPRSITRGHSVISHRTDKLQLVKPLEGSLTLLRWHRLALPGIENLLGGSHDGIHIKGTDQVSHFEQEPHSISDCEEDDDPKSPDDRLDDHWTAGGRVVSGSTAAGQSPRGADSPQRPGKSKGKAEEWRRGRERADGRGPVVVCECGDSSSSSVRCFFEIDDDSSNCVSRSDAAIRCIIS